MEKGIVVDTNGKLTIQEFDEPLYLSVGKAVEGYIEVVHPQMLKEPYVMIVNEEGLILNFDVNGVGSFLYGSIIHGQPIVGNCVFMKTGFRDGEPDIVGLDDEDIKTLTEFFELMGVEVDE